ncbi:MAG: prepilin-type N-terminal cleavage/methylation domain-containing protein, partial [Phycisphaerae bacterium]|nr:prepilin-type N-terminal cleavage/methylation domain-containing protein [Phycisphaerae bacterium]
MTTRPAFTLIELVLALATTSLLLLGVSSAIVVA